MQLKLKKCIHLMVILLALIETFTGAIIDCVIYTVFYSSTLEHEGASTSGYYFSAYLLPTKHFYRLIIVLYVPILYLWRSHGVARSTEGSASVSAGSVHGRSRVLRIICTRFPRHILPAAAGWLWHLLRALQSTSAHAPLADSEADCSGQWQWYESRKSWGALVHCRDQQHNSVIKQYNTRVSCIIWFCAVCFCDRYTLYCFRLFATRNECLAARSGVGSLISCRFELAQLINSLLTNLSMQ